MNEIERFRRLWEHAVQADRALLQAVAACDGDAGAALRELAHVVAAEELWLARLQQRAPRCAVWPTAALAEVQELAADTHTAYREYLAGLGEVDLDRMVDYVNSAGHGFTSAVGDILLHVALHGQYHRGKVNLCLRTAGCEPAPTDYIAFARGAPAARSPGSRGQSQPGKPE